MNHVERIVIISLRYIVKRVSGNRSEESNIRHGKCIGRLFQHIMYAAVPQSCVDVQNMAVSHDAGADVPDPVAYPGDEPGDDRGLYDFLYPADFDRLYCGCGGDGQAEKGEKAIPRAGVRDPGVFGSDTGDHTL